MQIIQIKVDKVLKSIVGIDRVVSAEYLVKANLPKQFTEALDIVRFLQTVQGIQHLTQLVIAVLGKSIAALRLRNIII